MQKSKKKITFCLTLLIALISFSGSNYLSAKRYGVNYFADQEPENREGVSIYDSTSIVLS